MTKANSVIIARLASGLLALCVGSVWAGAQAGKEFTVELRMGQAERPSGFSSICEDASGVLVLAPFGNDVGKLLFRVDGTSVRLDNNGDGRIDQEDAPAFEPAFKDNVVQVNYRFGGQIVKYPLNIRSAQTLKGHGRKMVGFGDLGLLEGAFDGHRIQIAGPGVRSGTFASSDCFVSVFKLGEALNCYFSAQKLSWLVVGDRLLSGTMEEKGTRLRLTCYEGAVARFKAEAAAPFSCGRVMLGNDTHSAWAELGKEGRLPPGTYTKLFVALVDPAKSSGNVFPASFRGVIVASRGDPACRYELAEGANTIRVGPPFELVCRFERREESVQLLSVAVKGVAGEVYEMSSRPERNEDSYVWFLRGGGEEQVIGKLEFG